VFAVARAPLRVGGARAISRRLLLTAPCPGVGAGRRPLVIDPDPADPDCLGIDSSLPPAQRRDADPERLGDLPRRQVPSLLQLEHSPMTAAVLVAVDVSGNPAPIVVGLEPNHFSAAALAGVLSLVLLEPSERGRRQ
jgi:hypothetical protein